MPGTDTADRVVEVLIRHIRPLMQQRANGDYTNGHKPAALFCDRDSDVDIAVRNELDALFERHPELVELAKARRQKALRLQLCEALTADDHLLKSMDALLLGNHSHPVWKRHHFVVAWWSDGLIARVTASIWMNILIAIAFASVYFTIWGGPSAVADPATVSSVALRGFAVWCLAFLPGWLYVRFLGQRAGALWCEYVLNLHRLGWDLPKYLPRPIVSSGFFAEWQRDGGALEPQRKNIYRLKFDASYGPSIVENTERTNFAVRTETMFPVFLATAALAVGWTATLWSTSFLQAPSSVWDVQKFGFLGAYAFISQSLIRRFFQSDLRPSAYAAAVLRVVLVALVVAAVDTMLQANLSISTRCVVAFGIGVFPLAGLLAVQRLLATVLRVFIPPMSPAYPLDQLDGLNLWDQARLIEEGIEDMENLASANFVDLMLHTRIPLGRFIDWCDQALLYLHLDRIERTWLERHRAKPKAQLGNAKGANRVRGSLSQRNRAGTQARTSLRQLGIRTATDLLKAFPPENVDPLRSHSTESDAVDLRVVGIDWQQIVTLVRVIDRDSRLNVIWNWQCRGPAIRRCSGV